MKKSVISALVCAILTCLGANAQNTQNSVWAMPNNFIDFNLTPPQPTPFNTANDYNGDPATCVSNAMQDENGDLLFFIVDNMIYDKDGFTIGDLNDSYSSSLPLNVKGTAEIAIVPVPGNCSQYYIFMAGRRSYVNSMETKVPVVAKIDMSEPTDPIYSPGKMGSVLYCKTIQDYLPSSAPDILIQGRYGKQGNTYFAASKEHNAKRFVFIGTERGLYRFVVDANSFQYDGFLEFSLPSTLNGIYFRGEMELVEVNNNSDVKYRLAVAIPADENGNRSHTVYIANLDVTGNLTTDLNGLDEYHLPYNFDNQLPTAERPNIHGLEFSPNGDILYITHQTNE